MTIYFFALKFILMAAVHLLRRIFRPIIITLGFEISILPLVGFVKKAKACH